VTFLLMTLRFDHVVSRRSLKAVPLRYEPR
jgi:hypothetical protein